MPVPINKEDLIKDIVSTSTKLRKKFQTICSELPLEATEKKDLPGHAKGTKMSLCNLVSYLVGWGELVLKWNKIKEEGKEPDFPESGYKWNELGQLAQKFYNDYENVNFLKLIKKYDKVVNDILTLIESKTNKQLYGENWYTKWTLGRMIQFNTSSPYRNAYTRILSWQKQLKCQPLLTDPVSKRKIDDTD